MSKGLEPHEKSKQINRKLKVRTTVTQQCGCRARVEGRNVGKTRKLAETVRNQACDECREEKIDENTN